MTWYIFCIRTALLKCAAIFAAYFVFVGDLVAQEVTFRSIDNAVEVTGRFIAFDGDAVTVVTDAGLVSFRAANMTCADPACPDLQDFVPSLRIIGAPQIGDVLMPALINVYARDRGWTLTEDADGFQMSQADGRKIFAIEASVANPEDAFTTFVNHDADVFLSMRSLRRAELDIAQDAGLGRLDTAGQGRILALSALVPVISPSSSRSEISLAELTAAFAGQDSIYDVHLPNDLKGQLEGFEDRFMRPSGTQFPTGQFTMADRAATIDELMSGSNGLALLPFGATGNTRPLSLSGSCGLQSRAEFLAIKTEDYPLTFPIFLYSPRRNQHSRIVDFLDWLRSPSAQLVIRRAGFVDLAAVPIPLGDQGDRLANAIANAGTEVPLIELQRLVRVLSPRVRMSSTFRFEPGSTRLDGQSRSNVMQLAQAIRDGRFGGRELMLIGFSDGRGPALANRDLSAARAESVRRDVLRALGNDLPDNVLLESDAFGEALPMACDDTAWGQQTNRRVELWIRDARD